MRKKRSDRNHVIYLITNTVNNKQYIGLTVAKGRAFKWSAKNRFDKHISRARIEWDKDWPLYRDMRRYEGIESAVYDVAVLSVVRGKREAHMVETELINTIKPKLNG